jgi:hypothetical protein
MMNAAGQSWTGMVQQNSRIYDKAAGTSSRAQLFQVDTYVTICSNSSAGNGLWV